MHQTTNTVLLVSPSNFRLNEETAMNNYFQDSSVKMLPEIVQQQAEKEFSNFVNALNSKGIKTIVLEAQKDVDTPDAIFPNNWISFHENGRVAVYPMYAENRRLERRDDVFTVLEGNCFKITDVIDYTSAEEEDIYLEGTGSMILDRVNRKAYCALSHRSDEDLFIEFCEDFEFTPIVFNASQDVKGDRKPIYHTNVMMCIAETFAIICLDSIDDAKERKNIVKHLKSDGKEIISITKQQMHQFAGNMLQVRGENDMRYLVMSQSAYGSLTSKQIDAINKHCEIISSNLSTIETLGGGSARCMLAEVFLPKP